MTDEQMARLFHATYESLAPKYGYVTKSETRKFNPQSLNGRLMIETCKEVRRHIEAIEAIGTDYAKHSEPHS